MSAVISCPAMKRLSHMWLLGAGLFALAACSRAPLREDGVGSQGDGASGAGASGAGGAGAGGAGASGTGASGMGGAGGSAPPCSSLEWVGDPVFVPVTVGAFVMRPQLIRVGGGRLGLVFESPASDGTTLLASALVDPWDAWPPEVGPMDANFPLAPPWTRFATSVGEPDRFAFAAYAQGAMVLGQATPGENGSSFIDWPAFDGNGDVKALARSTAGSYLVARGPESGLIVELLPGYVPDLAPFPVGTFGCAVPFVVADAVPQGDGAFLLAHTSDLPFDDCLDPDLPGPPLVVQTWRVSSSGAQPGTFIEDIAPVFDLSLSDRGDGAFLTYRAEGDPTVHIFQLDELGMQVEDYSILGNASDRDHTIAWFDGFAHATTTEAVPDGLAPVRLRVFDGSTVSSVETPLSSAAGRPAIVHSPAGGSFVVAVAHGTAQNPSVALLRADCVGD